MYNPKLEYEVQNPSLEPESKIKDNTDYSLQNPNSSLKNPESHKNAKNTEYFIGLKNPESCYRLKTQGSYTQESGIIE